MTGIEHYKKAERLLATVTEPERVRDLDLRVVEITLAAAQVHATLALAAATVVAAPPETRGKQDWCTLAQVVT